jgi:thiol-disulfide isomerase/thioredoxin
MKYAVVVMVLFCSCYGRKPKFKTGLEGKPMPAIELLAADSTTIYRTNSIVDGKPTILFSFETWCPYCKAQMKSIISQINSLKDVNIYLLCYTQYPEFKEFYKHYELGKYPNIKAGIDYNMTFAKYFKSTQIPYLAVYDTQKNLKQVFVGKTPIRSIKEAALE